MSRLEFVCPLIAAWLANKKISKRKVDSFDKKYSTWEGKLKKQTITEIQIADIARDIYADESQRTSNIENKGSWLLIGTGISVLLISLVLNFSLETKPTQIVTSLLFAFSIVNLALAGIGVHCATKIGKRHILDTSDFSKVLENKGNNGILDWSAKQLAAIESNYPLIIQKVNLISASQKHFIYGLVSIVIGFSFSLYCQTISTIFNS